MNGINASLEVRNTAQGLELATMHKQLSHAEGRREGIESVQQ